MTIAIFTTAGVLGVIAGCYAVELPDWTDHSLLGDKLAGWLLLFAPLFATCWAIGAHRRGPTTDIRPVETLWSWRHAGWKALYGSMIGGVILFLILHFREAKDHDVHRELAWYSLVIFLLLLAIVFGGLKAVAREMAVVPNHGIRTSIRRSIWSALVGGPTVAIVMTLMLVVVAKMFYPEHNSTLSDQMHAVFGLVCAGVAAGVRASQHYGGMAVLQHYLLRCILSCGGSIPWRFSHFLDYAADELCFLQKVGGGYIFVHRYLLEHFAAMETATVPEQTRWPGLRRIFV
jgi:hypothetical protein